MPLTIGQVLKDRYRIIRLLGQGGFGAVYRAWDTTFELPCAIKENFETSDAARRQFLREARLLHTLRHANLPQVKDYFIIPDQGQYLVMDFVDGEDLGQMVDQAGGPLPEAQVLDWAGQLCDALDYLHNQDPPIIHRDIKPANIKLTPSGKVMLVDFGIAKTYDPNTKTTQGAKAITPGYSPPEQYGLGVTDLRSDLYALGATLYHLLTGKTPLPSINAIVGGTTPATVQSLSPSVSPHVSAAIERAMQIKWEDRFSSAAEMKAALQTPTWQISGVQMATQVSVKESPQASQPLTPEQSAPIGPSAGSAQPTAYIEEPSLPPAHRSPARQTGKIAPGEQTAPGRKVKRNTSWVWIGAAASLVLLFCVAGTAWFATVLGGNRLPTPDVLATRTYLAANAVTEQALATPTLQSIPTLTSTPEPSLPSATPTLASTATPTELPRGLTDAQGVEMALVPAGEFQMGSVADAMLPECLRFLPDCKRDVFMDEEPVHRLFLDTFYIDIYEVTNALYEKCVNEGVCTPPESSSEQTLGNYYGDPKYANYPVFNVNWEQAITFCDWRSARLPNEAEWEKAARGGLEGKLFPWGDEDIDCTRANYGGCLGDVSQVGQYPANGYGLYDMSGNLWEWVSSLFRPYPYQADDGRENLTALGDRVGRGGSWYVDIPMDLRAGVRGWSTPSDAMDTLGFRCARLP